MRLERVIDFQNKGVAKTAIMTLPLGPTYEAIHIALLGGLLVTDIESIIGFIDNKPFFTVSGPDLQKQVDYEGYSIPTDRVTLDFTLPDAIGQSSPTGATSQAAERLLTCLPSAAMQSLTFQIRIGAGANALSDMSALMQIAEPSRNPFIKKQYETAQSLAGANVHNILLPTGEAGGMLQKLFMHTSGDGVITNMEIRNNGVTIMEAKPDELAYIQTELYGKIQQADMTAIDFHLQGMRSKMLNTVMGKNTFLRLTTDDAMDVKIYTRFIDPINRK